MMAAQIIPTTEFKLTGNKKDKTITYGTDDNTDDVIHSHGWV